MNVLLKRGLVALIGTSAIILSHAAAPIEGYWRSMDDQTGEPLSVVQITQESDGTYAGKITYRYPNALGLTLENCDKCRGADKGKPVVGLKILTHLVQDKENPNVYTDGKCIDVKNGKVYSGKVWIIANGRQLKLRGYIGISVLGRNMVWIRTDSPIPHASNEK